MKLEFGENKNVQVSMWEKIAVEIRIRKQNHLESWMMSEVQKVLFIGSSSICKTQQSYTEELQPGKAVKKKNYLGNHRDVNFAKKPINSDEAGTDYRSRE